VRALHVARVATGSRANNVLGYNSTGLDDLVRQ
jgi:hypothetical protein